MESRISVIVPVYNVERYLTECLDSIINQTYRQLEVILVDDASPDGCGAICDRYAGQDPRIRVIHKEQNQGLAEARNTGMETASGDYIFFVDSDDRLAQDALERLLAGMKKYSADCCVGGCVTVTEREGAAAEYQNSSGGADRCETALEAMKHVLLCGSSAWNRLYKRETLEGLRFPGGRINEDEPFMVQAYARMERVAFLEAGTYFYRKRSNSITTSAFSVKSADCVQNSRENLEFVKKRAPELIPCAQYKYVKTLLWCYVNLRKLAEDDRVKNLKREIHREIRKNRKIALRNPYLSLSLKVLALLCQL